MSSFLVFFKTQNIINSFLITFTFCNSKPRGISFNFTIIKYNRIRLNTTELDSSSFKLLKKSYYCPTSCKNTEEIWQAFNSTPRVLAIIWYIWFQIKVSSEIIWNVSTISLIFLNNPIKAFTELELWIIVHKEVPFPWIITQFSSFILLIALQLPFLPWTPNRTEPRSYICLSWWEFFIHIIKYSQYILFPEYSQ